MAKRLKTTSSSGDSASSSSHNRLPAPVIIDDTVVDAKTFYNEFVQPRLPAKFSHTLRDADWQGNNLWTNDYLRRKSGDAKVRVEHRNSVTDSFGQGKELEMTFGSFLDSLHDETYYLTTQELTYSPEGQPSLTSPPVDGLVGDFPFRPLVMGNLIPQNYNLWFGSSKQPSTSGLHHDYHDNLYILLRGEKHITLFSPHEAAAMYTYGDIARIHPNGRINYKGQLTNPDGSDPSSMASVQATAALNAATKLLAEDEEEGERQIEDALEALLDAEMDGEGGDEEEDDEDEEEEIEEGDDEEERDAIFDAALLPGKSTSATNPSNFSRVNTALPLDELKRLFPLFHDLITQHTPSSHQPDSVSGSGSSSRPGTGTDSGKKRTAPTDQPSPCFEVTVKAGEMLYIPAGWFHEVRSSGGGAEGHMAFNYWFHPPDGSSFEEPYSTDFWKQDLESRNVE